MNMKGKDFEKLVELKLVGDVWFNANEAALDLTDTTKQHEIVHFKECTARDLSFHKCYMSLLSFIYDYLPKSFEENYCSKKYFYTFIKFLKKEYKVICVVNGVEMIEYDSIAFGNMSQKRFENYIREQLPWIYENVLGKYFKDKMLCSIVNTIEDEYKKFLSKL